jgi:AcrR family transcriptional regulator/DNA-binding XRE family transcriptional regulator
MRPPVNIAHVGQQVLSLRTARGWSMRELASRLDVSAATVNAIEHGRTGISADRLNDLARTFDVPMATLLGSHTSPESIDGDPAISAAISAFVEAGYHGSSMRTIAERAGMSLASIYHYYPSKQSLLVKILDMTMDELDWRCAVAIDGPGGPLDRLYRVVEALALFHTLRAEVAYIGASEMRSFEEPERTRIAARRSAIQHLVDHEILSAVREGSAGCERPRETGRAIATMCTSLPQWFNKSGPTGPEAIARTYAELALRMIDTNPARLHDVLAAANTSTKGPAQ